MGQHKLVIIFSILAIFLLQSVVLVASEEVDRKEEFSYESGSERGPEHWGEINKEWATCGNGNMQSPIDLADNGVQIRTSLGLHLTYHPAMAIVKNRGHDIMVKWEDEAGGMRINGTEYALKQLHWHSPSEHAINGHRYPLEMHMVHQSADKNLAVVGILYMTGDNDPFLAKMEGYIKQIAAKHDAEEAMRIVDPWKTREGTSIYYRYMGSLTTPPCTEGVIWTIIKEVRTVSQEQLSLLREAVSDDTKMNARPIQEIKDRIISLYQPPKSEF